MLVSLGKLVRMTTDVFVMFSLSSGSVPRCHLICKHDQQVFLWPIITCCSFFGFLYRLLFIIFSLPVFSNSAKHDLSTSCNGLPSCEFFLDLSPSHFQGGGERGKALQIGALVLPRLERSKNAKSSTKLLSGMLFASVATFFGETVDYSRLRGYMYVKQSIQALLYFHDSRSRGEVKKNRSNIV